MGAGLTLLLTRQHQANLKGDIMATTQVAITPMRAAQVPKPGADFEMVEREIPKPGAREVRIKVQACGKGSRRSVIRERWLVQARD